jgi:hypothetical protein
VGDNPDDHAYWREAYGIDRPWRHTPGRRRGCLVMLGLALLLVIGVLLAGLLSVVL